jgi:hypothetical protein
MNRSQLTDAMKGIRTSDTKIKLLAYNQFIHSFIHSKNSEEFDNFGTFLIQVRDLEFREKLFKRICISNPYLKSQFLFIHKQN